MGSAAAAVGEYQFLTQTGSSQPSDVVQNVKGVAFSPAIDFGGAQLSQGFCYVDPGGNASTVSMCSFTPINNEVSTTYFGTVWVNNLYQESGNYPHLSFIVEEEINSVYTPVVEYASGDITSTVGSWAQIGFHFQLSTSVSECYRLRLVVNDSSTLVYRFGIDQFWLYFQLLPL